MYDAIVVGARCAGSPTAMLLSRRGYRVLLLDRDAFPSNSIRNHFIQTSGVARLAAWGLLDAIKASNCPPQVTFLFDVGAFALKGSAPPIAGINACYGPRRIILDKILVDGAIAAGAELREAFTVDGLLTEGDRVTGIRGHGTNGRPITETARIVIGADGQYSTVAKATNAPTYNEKPALACWYYSYWSGVPVMETELYVRDYRCVIAFATNDGLTCIAAAWPQAEFATIRTDVKRNHAKSVALCPSLADRVRSGRREERFLGSGDLPNFFRKPYGPGWALVGDSGYHKDPMLAQGITDAFVDAELLVDSLDDGFAGRRPMEEALALYERRRNESVMPMYEYNAQLAMLAPPPMKTQQLFAALRENRPETDRFFGTITGSVGVSEYFAPENVERIIGERR